MAVTAHRGKSNVEEVNVSQGTRSMARPCTREVRTLSQEWDDLVAEKKELELKLQGYSKTAFLKEQHRIRKGSGDTLTAWVNRKVAMEEERSKLLQEKNIVETRMRSIKDSVKQEARDRSELSDPKYVVLNSILQELQAIRTLLESK